MSGRSQDGAGGVIAILLAATALVALGIVGWLAFAQSDPTPWNKPAKVDGAVVQLTYTGSECQDHADVDVEEGSDRVVITVRQTVRAMSCNDVGVSYEAEVRLHAPLADRELVDGACEMPEYANYIECGSKRATVASGAAPRRR